jgi:hypothetical protein
VGGGGIDYGLTRNINSVQTLTGHIDFLFNFGGGPTAGSAY